MKIEKNHILSYKKIIILVYGIGIFIGVLFGTLYFKDNCIKLAGIFDVFQEQLNRTSISSSYILCETLKKRGKEFLLLWLSHSFKWKIMIHILLMLYEGFFLTVALLGLCYSQGITGCISFLLYTFPHRFLLLYLIYFSLKICCLEKNKYLYSKKEKTKNFLSFLCLVFLEIIIEVYVNEGIFMKLI